MGAGGKKFEKLELANDHTFLSYKEHSARKNNFLKVGSGNYSSSRSAQEEEFPELHLMLQLFSDVHSMSCSSAVYPRIVCSCGLYCGVLVCAMYY